MNDKTVCIIGAGNHATANIYPSVLLAGASIAAVSTRNLSHSKSALTRFGSIGNAYDDYSKMLDEEKCSHVIVVAQANDAFDIVLDCLRRGKHVLTEKPLGMSADEAQKIYDTAIRCGGTYMVGFMKRYAPAYRQLKKSIDEKEYGDICSFRATFSVDASRFCATDRDFIYFVSIHYLDLLRYLFGEVKKLSCYKYKNDLGTSYALSMKMESGAVGTLTMENRTAWTRETEDIVATFENGFIEVQDVQKVTCHKSASPEKVPWTYLSEKDTAYSLNMAPMSGTARDLYIRGFAGEIEYYLNGDHPETMLDNLWTVQLCDKVLKSLD